MRGGGGAVACAGVSRIHASQHRNLGAPPRSKVARVPFPATKRRGHATLAAAGCPHACQLVTAPVRIQRRWRAHATPARKEGAALQRLIQRANTGGQSADNGYTLYVLAAPRGRLRATAYLPRRTARDTPVRGSIVRGTPIWRTQARRFPTYHEIHQSLPFQRLASTETQGWDASIPWSRTGDVDTVPAAERDRGRGIKHSYILWVEHGRSKHGPADDGEMSMWMKDRRGMCAWTGWNPIMPRPR